MIVYYFNDCGRINSVELYERERRIKMEIPAPFAVE